jgi:hypothetical protein
MAITKVPVDRRYLGILTLACWLAGTVLWFSPLGESAQGLAGTLVRIAVLLSCLWFVTPNSLDRTSVRVEWPLVLGWLIIAILVIRTRMPLGYLLMAAFVGGICWLFLQPWRSRPKA